MKTTKSLKIKVLAIFTTLALTSCSKQGPTGPTGPAGQNGAANITEYSYTVTPGEWSNTNGIYYFNTNLSIPNSSQVNTYVAENNTGYEPLPVTSYLQTNDELSFDYLTGYTMQIAYLYGSQGPQQTLYFNIIVTPH